MGMMDTLLEVEECKEEVAMSIAVRAKAVKYCPNHDDTILDLGDPNANELAYEIAAEGLASGEYSDFKSQQELTDKVQSVIDSAAESCYSCERF